MANPNTMIGQKTESAACFSSKYISMTLQRAYYKYLVALSDLIDEKCCHALTRTQRVARHNIARLCTTTADGNFPQSHYLPNFFI